ncbi:hypothetical protein EWH99_06900 [Sporolactobacillus sp. THM7-7]|nr:hypothetical protein EWH99_06900 [Sporolactobacillus sp. THM7-7]
MMTAIWVILAVIAFIFYIARSVEKQNEQERKRREARRTRPHAPRMKPLPQNQSPRPQTKNEKKRRENRPSVPQPERTETTEAANGSDWMKRYEKARARLASEGSKVKTARERNQAPGIRDAEADRTDWLKSKKRLREAFIFAECIQKPRASHPHPFFTRKRY